ncbi:MAG: starch-binding protein [Barnesiella sp.]|nr:starch-binding protein [Barnesiella sp.]
MKKLSLVLAAVMCFMSSLTAGAETFVGDRTDFRDETIYFAMTTRFYDGDPTNNVCGWDHQDVQIANNDPDWRGDFKGLIDKLDYIKALGFTAIWITPIVQNCSGTDFHGYHAMDFSKVDLRYESKKEWGADQDVSFQSLIDAAHAKGMKIVLDIVLNHTGNFGEAHFAELFYRSPDIRNQASVSASIIPNYDKLPANYNELGGTAQYNARFPYLKNSDGTNKDNHNYWHHVGTGWNWDLPNRWWGQIAGDCVDLNTENPAVSEYLVKCYGKFIEMGVDGFRIDTTGHISRLTFNTSFIPQFLELGEKYKDKRLNQAPFFMFGECCARFSEVTYRDQPNLSSYFYTWKSPDDLVSQWNHDASFWDDIFIKEGDDSGRYGNMALCDAEPSVKRESDNVFLKNGQWHEPDYSDYSGFSIIDFPAHYNFNNAGAVVGVAKSGDKYYNDASFNVVYVDSHDYCPGPNDGTRFNGGTEQWAENLSLMFTFRGIPCIYYGSEVEFQKGCKVDAGGTEMPVKESGRAYFGHYLEGDVTASDFAAFSASGNVAKTLNGDLSQHIIRLNQIRAAVPALRKGQYTFDGCTAQGGWAFKRAYKDSYALVAINGGATFTGVPAGTYTDLVTGQTYQGGGSITVSAPSNKGQLRVLVKDWKGGKVGEDGKFIYTTSAVAKGGKPSFTDPGTTQYYTADDAIGAPSLTFDPAGCAFKTETLTVNVSLNEAAAKGWYQIAGGQKVPVTSSGATFIIGKDMEYGESVDVSWGVEDASGAAYTGKVTYKKVDPNATITVYVLADTAPNLYSWTVDGGVTKEFTGAWPGNKLTQTKTFGEYEYFCHTFDDAETVNIIFNMNGGSKTGDIKDITSDTWFTYDGATGYEVVTDPENPFNGQGGGDDPEHEGDWAIYFDNTASNWSTVNCYIYNGPCHEITGGWPGKQMQKFGQNLYIATFSTDKDLSKSNVIFNGNGQQSPDNVAVRHSAIYNAQGDTGQSSAPIVAEDENDTPEYYNLQGIRVAAPSNGFYIVKQNGRFSKVYIR